jgi:hypothetical protein
MLHKVHVEFAKGKVEPALALTIPDQPTDDDDGLLTASEIAQRARGGLGNLNKFAIPSWRATDSETSGDSQPKRA